MRKARAAGDFLHEEMERLIRGEHSDPHSLLGAHPKGNGSIVLRTFHPEARGADVLRDKEAIPMERVHAGGIFAAEIAPPWPCAYKLRFHSAAGETWEEEDPYRFLPTLGETDLHLAGEGTHYRIYDHLGAHPRVVEGTDGVSFAVWAPNARAVSVIGDFNFWDGRRRPMRCMGSSGIWELFIPGIQPGALYKFEIRGPDGSLRVKSDPMACAMELRSRTASIVWDLEKYSWEDEEWMKTRPARNLRQEPMAIYEVHLGSWRKKPGEEGWYTYREIAPLLVEEARKFGFTHLELLPVAEHPLDASWGYQVTGYYAPTSRYGTPDDFKFFVDHCHQSGIGVILDWVPAHFPKDDYSLRWFDGTALYEHQDPRQAEHRDWDTLIFNYGRNEVRNFLLANALFWLDKYHIDALRVDAVASMLYLDYSRQEGEWVPNAYGGRENLEAIDFLRRLNELVYGLYPGAFTVAEESTDWGGVTLPAYLGGLGFGFKWNMGWMHDTLLYFGKDPVHRSYHHNTLTFSMLYEYTENFILPLSHDEVVYGKRSLLSKMPGDLGQKFSNLRLLLAYMYTHPGKKLLFMGSELAPDWEWDHTRGLDWELENDPQRKGFQKFFLDLSSLYRENRALWEWDHDPRGFTWIDCQDSPNSVVSYIRRGHERHLVCVLNLTPVPRTGYRIGVPEGRPYRERLNSDSEFYGGSNMGNGGHIPVEPVPFHGHPQSVSLILPPLSCLILEPQQ